MKGINVKIIEQTLPDSTLPTEGQNLTAAQANTDRDLAICGTVRMVELSRDMLFLQLPSHDSEDLIHWQPQTRFRYHGAEVKPESLHRGQTISVQFSSDAGEKFVTEIDIVAEPSGAESTAAQRQALWPKRSVKRAPK